MLPQRPPVHRPSGYTLGRHRRLRKPREFAAIRRAGRSWSNDLLFLRTLANGRENNRFGFSVGRRVGNAVVRNLVKRRLKEIVRQRSIHERWDILLSARPPAARATYRELERAVEELLRRAKLMNRPNDDNLPPHRDIAQEGGE